MVKLRNIFLMTLVIVMCFTIPAFAAETTYDLSVNGDNSVIATFNDETGVLTISGSGATADYTTSSSTRTPLYNILKSVKEVKVDEGVTALGDYAFYYSSSNCLSKCTIVSLPSTLTRIGNNVFEGSAIQNIEIPAKVISIGDEAFYSGVSGAGTTVVFESGSKLETIGDAAFKDLDMTEIILPDGLKTIGANAFYSTFVNDSKMTTVFIPASVTNIGKYAFYGCNKVNNFTCLSTDLSLSESALGGENYLMGISESNKVATVDASQVYLADALKGLGYTVSVVGEVSSDKFASYPDNFVYVLGDNVKGYLNQYSGEFIIIGTGDTYDYDYYNSPRSPIWDDMDYITSLIIEEGVTSLGDNVFYTRMSSSSYSNYCTLDECTSVSLPSTLTRIGANNFHNSGLTSITIPANVVEIGEGSFYGADYTINFETGSKLTTIGNNAFERTGFESIDLPGSVTTIGEYAFAYSSITSIDLPSNLKTISRNAFQQAPLTSIEIPASVSTIGINAFVNCSSLTSLTFEDGSQLSIIPDSAFYNTKITSLTIPDSVTTIEASAFKYCYYLEKVIIPESVATIGKQAFYEYGEKAGSITLMNYADSVQTIGTDAFETDIENVTVYQYQANAAMTTALSESSASPVAVYYFDDIVLSGDLENGIHWEYDPDTKTLTFTGNGDIPDYTDGSQPWYGAATQYGGIGTYKFGDGITGIGNGVFGSYGNSAYGANGSGATAYGPAGLSYGGATYSGTVSGGSGGGGGSTGGEGGSGGGSGDSGSTGDGSDESTTLPKDEETMIILDAQPTNFMVTVPIAINAVMDGEGNVTTGDGYYVENACAWGPVVIKDIVVVAETNWDLADWNSDFANMKASTKKLAMTINGVEVAVTGAVSMNDSLSSVIKYQDSKELTFEVKLPAQKVDLQENIAAVVFTVDFDKV